MPRHVKSCFIPGELPIGILWIPTPPKKTMETTPFVGIRGILIIGFLTGGARLMDFATFHSEVQPLVVAFFR